MPSDLRHSANLQSLQYRRIWETMDSISLFFESILKVFLERKFSLEIVLDVIFIVFGVSTQHFLRFKFLDFY